MVLQSLTIFVNFVLAGDVASLARPYFFGVTLTALNKKDGGVRPIAVGCTLRRLAAKCAEAHNMRAMGAHLAQHQLGCGVPMGTETAAHAACIFLHHLQPGHLLLKLDFKNAFNCLHRQKIAVRDQLPELFPLVLSAYSAPSCLFFGQEIIQSTEGVQQGYSLGPLLFCITIHNMVQQLCSQLNVFYLDYGNLGGSLDVVLQNFHSVEHTAGELGLQLNLGKLKLSAMTPQP